MSLTYPLTSLNLLSQFIAVEVRGVPRAGYGADFLFSISSLILVLAELGNTPNMTKYVLVLGMQIMLCNTVFEEFLLSRFRIQVMLIDDTYC